MLKEWLELAHRLVRAVELIAQSLGSAAAGGFDKVRVPDKQGTMHEVQADKYTPALNTRMANAARKSELHDLSLVSPEILERSRAAQVTFALDGMLVPWSEAHMRALKEYERKVDAEFGEGSSDQLPWRQVIPRGEEASR